MRWSLLVLVLAACGAAPRQAGPTVEPLPEFALTDVNPASTTAGQAVTPRSLRGKVSGWYFTHSG